MNINEDVLQGILADNGIYASEQEAVFEAIKIKPVDNVDCNECAQDKNAWCHVCKDSKSIISRFKPKPCEHFWMYEHYLTQAHRICSLCGEMQKAKFE